MIYENFFDELFVTETYYTPPELIENRLEIAVRHLGLHRDHPANIWEKLAFVSHSRMIFDDVTRSEREISRYRPKAEGGFFPSEFLKDGPFGKATGQQRTFGLEGVYETPESWIGNWEIDASRFRLEIPDEALVEPEQFRYGVDISKVRT